MRELRAGDSVAGKYRVERVLGRGGMGYVLEATHVALGDRVAIKLLLPEAAGVPDIVARFLREGRAARQIQSEHVVQVTDLATLPDGTPYMVMEFLEGSDLADLLRARGRLSASDAMDLILQAMEALAEAHVLGMVHRDLKPANLFVTRRRDGSSLVKVLDFGIAKIGAGAGGAAMTQTNGMMGSALYMSPEQLQSAKSVDARADIWALGVIFYELLTGSSPFIAEELPQVLVKIMSEAPTPVSALRPDLPRELVDAIMRCLEKNRERRFPNVGELAGALAPVAPRRAQASIDRIVRVLEGAGQRVSNYQPPQPSSLGMPTADAVLAGMATQKAPVAPPLMPATVRMATTGGAAITAKPSTTSRKGSNWIVAGSVLGALIVLGAGMAALARRGATSSAAAPSTESGSTHQAKPLASSDDSVTALVPVPIAAAESAPIPPSAASSASATESARPATDATAAPPRVTSAKPAATPAPTTSQPPSNPTKTKPPASATATSKTVKPASPTIDDPEL